MPSLTTILEDLPEDDRRGIGARLAKPLAYSKRALEDAIAVLPMHVCRPLDGWVYRSVLSIHVRACRRFRQVISLCEDGQGDGSEALARSLFETFLAQAFICRRSIKLGKRVKGKVHRGTPLTRKFRAKLYWAHDIIQREKTLRRMQEVSQHVEFAKRELAAHAKEIDAAKKVIGPTWATALNENTCAGLSVRDFADRLGPGAVGWYRTIYAYQSDQVHHSDPARFIDDGDDGLPVPRWYDRDQQIAGALWAANGAFGLAINELGKLVDRKHPRYVKLGVFENGYKEMKAAFSGVLTEES